MSVSRLMLGMLGLLVCLCSTPVSAAQSTGQQDYPYPLSNPFEATIAGTPLALMPSLPRSSDIRQKDFSFLLRPEREHRLSGNFWAVKRYRYRLAWQTGEAPLIFIIAGTAARYDATGMEYLKKLFYGAGFHVVQLSSPTSYDHMVSASAGATPGYSPRDAAELYAIMQRIQERHQQLQISGRHLTGYSLGGLQAAFLSELDSREQAIGLHRTLLINPPVNLLTSVSNLDRMARVKIDDVPAGESFYQSLFDRLARFFESKGRFDLNEAMLFEFQQSSDRLDDQRLALLIASAFRLAAADISFVSDLINRRGLITPAEQRIHDGSSLSPFFKQALLCDFNCYLKEQLLPDWRQHYRPQGTLQQLVQETSLYALENHLHTNRQLAVMHNADDIILGTGDLEFLARILGQRLLLYPTGGHLGNMSFQPNAAAILEFFNAQD